MFLLECMLQKMRAGFFLVTEGTEQGWNCHWAIGGDHSH